jgi:lysozyme
MSATDLAVARLQTDEGFRPMVYTDTTGHQTIGYGFNISAGISQYAALALLDAQAAELSVDLGELDWYHGLDDVRSSVCIELAFNLGLNGLLGFHQMIAALRSGDWRSAHDQLLNSEAARQLPVRYGQLADLLLNGE